MATAGRRRAVREGLWRVALVVPYSWSVPGGVRTHAGGLARALQAAVAVPLLAYGVHVSHGLLFGTGLQAIELAVAAAVGLSALAYEGLSFAAIRGAAWPLPADE